MKLGANLSRWFELGAEMQMALYYYPNKSPPSVPFHLYDEFREMSLRDFCVVSRIPFEGKLEEPHRRDVDDFV